jgi:hypothetical protein
LLVSALESLAPRQRAVIVAKQRHLVETAAALLARIAPALKPNPALRWPAAMGLYGFINWTYTWFDPEGATPPEAFADFAADLFLGGIVAAAKG